MVIPTVAVLKILDHSQENDEFFFCKVFAFSLLRKDSATGISWNL